MKSIKLAVKEQSHPSSEVSVKVAHHKTSQARNSFAQTRDLHDRPVFRVPQRALDKEAQTSNITSFFKVYHNY